MAVLQTFYHRSAAKGSLAGPDFQAKEENCPSLGLHQIGLLSRPHQTTSFTHPASVKASHSTFHVPQRDPCLQSNTGQTPHPQRSRLPKVPKRSPSSSATTPPSTSPVSALVTAAASLPAWKPPPGPSFQHSKSRRTVKAQSRGHPISALSSSIGPLQAATATSAADAALSSSRCRRPEMVQRHRDGSLSCP